MLQVLAESIDAGGLGLLHHAEPHPLRRRRQAGRLPLGHHRRAARAVPGGRRARGHHARGDRRRLPRPVQRRRDRALRVHDRRRPAPAQLERPHHRLARARARAAPAVAPTTAAEELGGRIVALTMPVLMPMNMSLPQPLRAVPHPGLGRDPPPPGARAHREAAGPRDAGVHARAVAVRGGRRLPPPRRLRPLRHRRHLRRGERGPAGSAASATSPPSAARTRSPR